MSKYIIDTAVKYLPRKIAKKKKSVIKDKEFNALCRASRTAWLKCRDAGRPLNGELVEEKKSTKKKVCQFVASARARLVRSSIQKRDRMFKENQPLHFKTSNPRTKYSKLVVDGQSVTATSEILHQFTLFFGSLAKSDRHLLA